MADGASVTCGVREMACRLNNDAASFDKAADNRHRAAQIPAAQIPMSAEPLRPLVEAEGGRVLQAQRTGAIPPAFGAGDCPVPDPPEQTRMSVGVEGVLVPLITDAEKRGRREKVVQKRRARESSGRKPAPLPPRRTGSDLPYSDLPYKEFQTVTFDDQANDHRHIVLGRTQRTGVGTVLKREAARLKFAQADERIGIVDGASWIPPKFTDAQLRLDGLGLDFYHLSENVHRCRRATFGGDGADGTT